MATLVYTFSPTLINEASWGINRGQQGVQTLTDTSADTRHRRRPRTYAQSQLPLKDSSGNPAYPAAHQPQQQYLEPASAGFNFGLPSGYSAQSAGQGVNRRSELWSDSRWPFSGTDQLQTVHDKITWVKVSHTFKAGVYYERQARNVSASTRSTTPPELIISVPTAPTLSTPDTLTPTPW